MMDNNYVHMAEIVKAALPHLDYKSLKIAGLFASFMEFMGSFYSFQNQDYIKALEVNNENNKEIDIEGLLTSIKPVCHDSERQMVDTLLNAFSTMKIFNMYNDIMEASNNTNSQSSSNLDLLKSFLPPEQVETFENLSMVLEAMSYDNMETCNEGSEENG